MKRNHEQVLAHLKRAIQACGEDGRMSPVKSAIMKAMAECEQVGKKRVRNATAAEHYRQLAVTKDAQWRAKLAEGMKKLLEMPNLAEPGDPSTGELT